MVTWKITVFWVEENFPKHLGNVGGESNAVAMKLDEDVSERWVQVGAGEEGVVEGDSGGGDS